MDEPGPADAGFVARPHVPGLAPRRSGGGAEGDRRQDLGGRPTDL
jgi:hypothetical protein